MGFSPDGKTLAVASYNDSELRIYDLPLPSPIPKIALGALLAMVGVYGLGTAAALSRKRRARRSQVATGSDTKA